MNGRTRLDVLLVSRGLAESRERAQGTILAGRVFAGHRCLDKPGMAVDVDISLEIRGDDLPYVSRGGLKLAKALDAFNIDPSGRVALDVGASTGGFTDCLLQAGAVLVYAVDVGYGQLAWKLREDSRVKVFERVNARYLDPGMFDPLPDMAVIDVSFISLGKVLPSVMPCIRGDGPVITLIKPQFEAGREKVGSKGVVRDPATHVEVLRKTIRDAGESGLIPTGLTYSPVRGPEGNIEFLAAWRRGFGTEPVEVAHDTEFLTSLVARAHREIGTLS